MFSSTLGCSFAHSSSPKASKPVPLTNGKHYPAEISHPRDTGLWSFDADQGDRVLLTMAKSSTSSTLWPNIQVVGPDGVLIAGGRALDVAFVNLLAPQGGTYLVLTSSDAGQGGSDRLDGTGAYSLTIAQVPEEFIVETDDEGWPLINGFAHHGTITPGDLDLWTFHATQGEYVLLSLGVIGNSATTANRRTLPAGDATTPFWPEIEVYGPHGGESLAGRHGLSVASVGLSIPETGTYTVLVHSNAGQGGAPFGGVGSYLLTLAHPSEPAFVLPGHGGQLQTGVANTGSIGVGGIDIWRLNAAAGETISLNIEKLSDETDLFWPNLSLIAPDGAPLAGGHTLTSRQIDAVAPITGVYTVLMTSDAGQGGAPNDGAGSYRLTSSHAGKPDCLVRVDLLPHPFGHQYMQASFSTLDGSQIDAYAKTCNFDYFEWQQTITQVPQGSTKDPNDLDAMTASGNILTSYPDPHSCTHEDFMSHPFRVPNAVCSIIAPPAFSDPPKGGYFDNNDASGAFDPFPFYYYEDVFYPKLKLGEPLAGGSFVNANVDPAYQVAAYKVSPDGKTISFLDGPLQPAGTMKFETHLVGVTESDQPQRGSIRCGPNGARFCAIATLCRWTWNSDFNGELGDAIITSGGASCRN